MADLGDLGTFLDEEPVADLDWLDVDKEEYREHMEALPEQNLDSIPELQAHLKDLSDAQAFHLLPQNREPAKPTTPFWSERPHFGRLEDEDVVALVEHFTRAQVQAGVKARTVISNLQTKFGPKTLAASRDRVRAVLEERGLLGEVYLDARLFPRCANGGVQRGLTARNRAATLLLAKSACVGCVHNREGRCGVFHKDLTFEVDYSESLWDGLQDRLLDKDVSDLEDMPVRARVQTAMLRKARLSETVQEHKPVVANVGDAISAQDAARQLMAHEGMQEVVGNVRLQRKQLRWAKIMMSNPHGKVLQERVAHDADLAVFKSHLHLLGPVYADISFFPTYKEASAFIEALPERPAHVVGMPYSETELRTDLVQGPVADVRHPVPLRATLNRYLELTQGPSDRQASQSQSVFDSMWAQVSSQDREAALEVARRIWSKTVSTKTAMYDAPYIYNPTKGVNFKQAVEAFKAYSPERITTANPREVSNREDIVVAMLRGDHSARVATLLEADPKLASLKPHLHLLGQLYVDTSLVSPALLKKAGREGLNDLPRLTPENRETFFTSPYAHAPLARRMAAHAGVRADKMDGYLRQTVTRLAKLSGEGVRKLALEAYARPVASRVATHDSPYRQWRPEFVSNEQMRGFVAQLAATPRKRVFATLEDHLKAPGGDVILDRLSHRVGLDVLGEVYLSEQDGKASSRVASSRDGLRKASSIIKAATDPSFVARGSVPPLSAFFKSKAGRFMRDRLMSGAHGARLSRDIKRAMDTESLVDSAPVVLAMREEEGLYGRVYVVADAYDDCHQGAARTASTVTQVVKSAKCVGCQFNRQGSCKAYRKPLVAQPVYDDSTVDRAIGHRVQAGELTRRQAETLRAQSGNAKTRTMLAHTRTPKVEASHDGLYQGHYGDLFKPAVDVQKAQKSLDAKAEASRAARTALETARDTSSAAPTAHVLMGEFEMAPAGGSLDFELNAEGSEDSFDITLDGDFILD